jgi:putative sigma-54 modulation protein
MRLQVKGKNVEVTPALRDYADRKLGKLSRRLSEQTQVEVELSEEKNPAIHDSQVAEATIFAKGTTIRARVAAGEPRAAIDGLIDKLDRQVTRYRRLRKVEPRRHADRHAPS